MSVARGGKEKQVPEFPPGRAKVQYRWSNKRVTKERGVVKGSLKIYGLSTVGGDRKTEVCDI